MASVDNRIVRMEFDNASFERKISSTLNSLKNLEKALQFQNSKKGFANISAEAKKINFNSLLDQAKQLDRSFQLPGAHRGLSNLGLSARKVDVAPLIDSARQVDRAFQLPGAQKGIADVGAAANKITVAPIGAAAQQIGESFLSMSTVAIAALFSISAAAALVAAKVSQEFVISPMISGFQEMETNMNSIQTILANTKSKGSNLEDVEKALQNLNEYSDKTIYNFGQMARNIGTFTAAGVGLNESVNAIKGIANLAAISGSNSEQASTAMYQLSQALSAGKVSLMDWNSVVNAGMGGEIFKTALFETGKAMGTIADVPLDQSFTEWEDAGNSFRNSLADEWIDEDVLSTTLEAFSGDLDETQLRLRGFSAEAAKDMAALGAQGQEAATSVKTLTQLMSTVKESIATGWADSFKAVIGGFEESKKLFTGINDFIGGFIGRSADARNKMLLDWKDAGGRFLLLLGFKNVVQTLLAVIDPIRKAFREIFPKKTTEDLKEMTKAFYRFSEAIKPSEKTVENIKRIFKGLFAALSIGWTVIKEGTKFIAGLFGALTGFGKGNWLEFFADIGDTFSRLHAQLVTGKGISEFFVNLRISVGEVISQFGKFKEAIADVIGGIKVGNLDSLGDATGRLRDRFGGLVGFLRGIGDRFSNIWEPIETWFDIVSGILDRVWSQFKDFFSVLGERIAKTLGKGDFNKVLDALNTGLLAGITLLIAKWLKKGIVGNFTFDIGSGFLKNLQGAVIPIFSELTNTLKALQTNLKADTLMKIAKAIALLTASVFVLTLIDSEALSRALGAMAVGFAQLMAAFAIITKLSIGPKGALSLNAAASAMITLSGAILILSVAALLIGTMDWDNLQRGLTGITVLLGVVTVTAILLSKHAGSFILASIGMVAISAALLLLSSVIAIFGTMEWDTIGRGLAAIVGSITAIALAMQLMPLTLPITAAGLILVSIALNAIAASMLIFGTMSWEEMGKGMAGIAGGLVIIALAMQLMPLTLPLTAFGLLIVADALLVIAAAMKVFGSMSWEEIANGLKAMGLSLLILAVAANAMSGAFVGAIAIGVVAVSLMLLAGVLKTFSQISTEDLRTALIGIAAALTVIGLAAYALLATGATVAILALGGALVVLGAGFLLIGASVYLFAKGIDMLAKTGGKGIEAIGAIIKSVGKKIPEIVDIIISNAVLMISGLLKAIPPLVKLFGAVVSSLLDELIKLIPKAVKAISLLAQKLIEHLRTVAPQFIGLGFLILTKFLEGLTQNIDTITNSVISIILSFVSVLNERMPEIVTAGASLLISFLQGLTDHMGAIVGAIATLIVTFIGALAENYPRIIEAGGNLIIALLFGIASQVGAIVAAITIIIITFIQEIKNAGLMILIAGAYMILSLISGMKSVAGAVFRAATDLILFFISGVQSMALAILWAGTALIISLIEGFGEASDAIITAGVATVIKFIQGLSKNAIILADAAFTVVTDFLNGLTAVINRRSPELREAGKRLAFAIANGVTGGMLEKAKEIGDTAVEVFGKTPLGRVATFLASRSPSKVWMKVGRNMADGVAVALRNDTGVSAEAVNLADRATIALKNSLAKVTDNLGKTDEFNPTITPVLDLTKVQADASKIAGYMNSGKLTPSFSIGQANLIASDSNRQNGSNSDIDSMSPSGEVKFEQNIYAPTRLSTADIYKQTRNQIKMAKEELKIP